MESKKFIFIFTLLLVAFFSDTSACGSRRGRRGRGHSSSHWSFGSSHSSSHHHSSSSHSSGSSHSSSYPSGSSHSSSYPSSSSHTSGSSHSSGYPSGSSHSSSYPSSSSHNSGHSGYDPRPSHTSSDSHPSSHVNHESHQPNHQSNNNGHNSQGQYGHQDNSLNSPYYPPIDIPARVPLPANVHFPGYYPLNHHHHHHYAPGSSNQAAGSSGTQGQNTQNNLYPAEEESPSTTTRPSLKEDVSWLQLSCEKRLCEFTKNYPLKEVESAVEEMNKVLSTNSLSSDAKHDVNKNVMDFFLTPNAKALDIKIDNSTECKEETTAISPLGGYDISGRPFIIVNVPKLSQEIKSSKCRAYDFCKEGSWLPYPWICEQSYREQELLVLPARQGSFNYTEFSVKTFKVLNGCQCVSMDQMNVLMH